MAPRILDASDRNNPKWHLSFFLCEMSNMLRRFNEKNTYDEGWLVSVAGRLEVSLFAPFLYHIYSFSTSYRKNFLFDPCEQSNLIVQQNANRTFGIHSRF